MDWQTFFSVFGLIFVAELGDKTQLAVVTQTCKHRRPWAVFIGASAALSAVTGLGVLAGQALGHLMPEGLLRIVAILAFLVMGLLIAQEAGKADAGAWSEPSCRDGCGNPGNQRKAGRLNARGSWRALGATLGLLFFTELGDKTQLAVLSLSSRYGNTWAVLGGAAIALTLVTALGVIGGRALCKIIPRRLLLWISAALFIVMSVLMGFGLL